MLEKFRAHLQDVFPDVFTRKTLLTVSGGIDSMVMLHLFHTLKLPIEVAHCNFNLRAEESDLDEQLVLDYCVFNNIIFNVNHFNTNEYILLNKVSIQVAARELRYEWFHKLLDEKQLACIATAHHLDDQVETFLINFNRGTGIDGFIGIPEKNGNIIRPLLPFTRDEILKYALENKVTWREDASNATIKYQRNKYRHLVVPIFKEQNPDFLQSFLQTQKNLKQTKELATDALDFFIAQYVKKTNIGSVVDLSDRGIKPRFTTYLQVYLKDFGFYNSAEILKLLNASTGAVLKNREYTILKNRETLVINKVNDFKLDFFSINNLKDFEKNGINAVLVDKTFELNVSDKNTIFVDADKLVFPMKLRKRMDGDVFQPFGFSNFKKVSKFYKDEKLSLFDKQQQWLLVNNNNDIVWVVGLRADDRFKVTNQTKKIYKLIFNQ